MSSEEVNQIRKHITMLRTAKGISQAELAKAVGINQAQISRIENGEKADISLSALVAICRHLGILVEDIVDPVAFSAHLTDILVDDSGSDSDWIEESPDLQTMKVPKELKRIPDPYITADNQITIGVDDQDQPFALDNSVLDKHMMVVGKTGSGKSEWLKWMTYGLAQSDYPTVFFDPYGTAADEMLNLSITADFEKVAFLDFSNSDFPPAYNPLDINSYEAAEETARSVLQTLFSPLLTPDSAPRAVVYAKEALIALCHGNVALKKADKPERFAIADLRNFFTDKQFRSCLISFCQDQTIRAKYDPETGPFELIGEKMQIEHTSVIISKIAELESKPSIRNVLSTSKNRLDFQEIVKENSMVIFKLSSFGSRKKELDHALGSMIFNEFISSFRNWGLTLDPKTREPQGTGCRVIVDESPTIFGPGSKVPEILVEARKYDLGLILSAQFPDQFDKNIKDALFANINSKIGFTQDPKKGQPFQDSIFQEKDKNNLFGGLPNWHFYGNVLVNSEEGYKASGPFFAKAPPVLNVKLTPSQIEKRKDLLARNKEYYTNDVSKMKSSEQRFAQAFNDLESMKE